MPVRWATTSGNWSNLAIWNDSASLGFPTASDDIWANNNSINIDQSFEVISLNSTARARTIATPAMTANNAPSPFVAAASTIAGASNDAWVAFNRVYTAGTFWATAGGQSTGWLSMDFGSGSSIIIDGYTIFGGNGQTLNPRNWTLESSNDNINWTIRHTVSGAAAIPANGSYSIASIGNTTGSRYYRLNVSLNGGSTQLTVTELELYQPGTVALAAGGSFIFNSGSISGSATSTTAALTAGATNLIQVTATTGSVGLTIGSAITGLGTATTQIFNHSGNCDFRLSGVTFTGGSAASAFCINKSSTGTINITGSLVGGSNASAPAFNSTAGNTIVLGSLTGITGNALIQSAGNATITGNIAASTGAVGLILSGPTSILTVSGSIAGAGGSNAHGASLVGASAQVIVTGNITAGGTNNAHGINLTGGSSQFTIIGNITGGSGGTSAFGINHSGTSGSVIGNVTGGSGNFSHGINTVGNVTVTGTVTGGTGGSAQGINNSAGTINVTGNVTGNVGFGLAISNNTTVVGNITGGSSGGGIGVNSTSVNITVTATGTVAASSTIYGIGMGGGAGTQITNLTGNMLNTSGRQAIFAQNLFISNAATSQWRLFTQGGQDKTLYSADTFPNQPSAANVRSGSLFGPANALSGSMVVPAPSDVRVNVLTDNTVGTGQSLTAADFLAAISSSADPFAQRLRNVATVDTVGSLVTGLNGGF